VPARQCDEWVCDTPSEDALDAQTEHQAVDDKMIDFYKTAYYILVNLLFIYLLQLFPTHTKYIFREQFWTYSMFLKISTIIIYRSTHVTMVFQELIFLSLKWTNC
jgi:hypothetical protein